MPTRRALTLLILALVLYFLANQTQVGWVHVITAGLIGLLVVTFFYSRGMLIPVRATRSIRNRSAVSSKPDPISAGQRRNHEYLTDPDLVLPAFHEDDALDITLQFSRGGSERSLPERRGRRRAGRGNPALT